MKIVKSNQDEDQIIQRNKHIMEKRRTNIDSVAWRCILKTCRATAVTALLYRNNLSSFELTWIHNHPPDLKLAIRKPLLEKMKDRIKITSESPRNVIYSVIRGGRE